MDLLRAMPQRWVLCFVRWARDLIDQGSWRAISAVFRSANQLSSLIRGRIFLLFNNPLEAIGDHVEVDWVFHGGVMVS